jgi:hypothetical protein
MKNLKFLAVAVVSAVASASSFAAISLTQSPANTYSGSFAGSATTNTYYLDLTGFSASITDLTSILTANYAGTGYNITGATFDGSSFTPVVNINLPSIGVDYWSLTLTNVSHAVHTIVVTGLNVGAAPYVGFTGSVVVSDHPIPAPSLPVPEPETYALMLAGLAGLGFVVRRRQIG